MTGDAPDIDFGAIFQRAEARKNQKRQAEQQANTNRNGNRAASFKKQKTGDTKVRASSFDAKSNRENYKQKFKLNDGQFSGSNKPVTAKLSGKQDSAVQRPSINVKNSSDLNRVPLDSDTKNQTFKSNKHADHKDQSNSLFPSSSSPAAPKKSGRWNFEVDYNDHFETTFQAVKDFSPVLDKLCKFLKKRTDKLVIYDPYFCQGGVKRHYARLGFPKVINENRDFYVDVAEGNVPEYDILITNPPYSEGHKTRILDFCVKSGKPWALLMPNYIATKKYYLDAIADITAGSKSGSQSGTDTAKAGAAKGAKKGAKVAPAKPFYLHPLSKYEYEHPEGTGHAESPFDSLWFVHLGGLTDAVFSACKAAARIEGEKKKTKKTNSSNNNNNNNNNDNDHRTKASVSHDDDSEDADDGDDDEATEEGKGGKGVEFLRSLEELREGRRVPTEKRPNPKMRRKLKAKREGPTADFSGSGEERGGGGFGGVKKVGGGHFGGVKKVGGDFGGVKKVGGGHFGGVKKGNGSFSENGRRKPPSAFSGKEGKSFNARSSRPVPSSASQERRGSGPDRKPKGHGRKMKSQK